MKNVLNQSTNNQPIFFFIFFLALVVETLWHDPWPTLPTSRQTVSTGNQTSLGQSEVSPKLVKLHYHRHHHTIEVLHYELHSQQNDKPSASKPRADARGRWSSCWTSRAEPDATRTSSLKAQVDTGKADEPLSRTAHVLQMSLLLAPKRGWWLFSFHQALVSLGFLTNCPFISSFCFVSFWRLLIFLLSLISLLFFFIFYPVPFYVHFVTLSRSVPVSVLKLAVNLHCHLHLMCLL